MQAIGRADLADDPSLASNDGRDLRRDELYGVIDRWANSLPLETLMQVLTAAEVPASRIYSAEDMFSDPQYLAREMFLQAKLPDGKPFKMPGIVPKLSETPGSSEWVARPLASTPRHCWPALAMTRRRSPACAPQARSEPGAARPHARRPPPTPAGPALRADGRIAAAPCQCQGTPVLAGA